MFIINNMLMSSSGSYSGYVAPPNYMFGWGEGAYGELDYNTTYARLTSVANLGSLSVITMANFNAMVIKSDGTLWGWGSNSNSQLGTNDTNFNISSPVQVGTLTNWSDVSMASDAGSAFQTVVAITS